MAAAARISNTRSRFCAAPTPRRSSTTTRRRWCSILEYFCRAEASEVIISRGELLQIGGGFRIPEILEARGARLREVGTTNQTSVNDYAAAINRNTALILKVHRSNFFMDGFVESPSTEDLAALARKKRVPFVEDLGSGAIVQTQTVEGVEHEPTPAEVDRSAASISCVSAATNCSAVRRPASSSAASG